MKHLVTRNETLENKIISSYLSDDSPIKEQLKKLHVGEKLYRSTIANIKYPTLDNKTAWATYTELAGNYTLFYRAFGLNPHNTTTTLIESVFGKQKVLNLVADGVPIEGIVKLIDLPFINESTLSTYLRKKKIQYSDKSRRANTNKKRAENSLKKYGVDNPLKSDVVKKKIEETNLKKYGGVRPLSSKEIQNKMKETMVSRYAVEYAMQNSDIKLKSDSTLFRNYGVINPMLSTVIKQRVSETNLGRYNISYPLGNRAIQAKAKDTMVTKYGVEYALQSGTIRDKGYNTIANRYGVKHSSQVQVEFTPTKYVQTKEQAIAITSTPEALEKFLKKTFPEQERFTLNEVSLITGRPYNTIKTTFSTKLPFIKPSIQGHLPEQMQNFLEELGYKKGTDFIINDRQAIKPLEIDFYFPKEKVGIEVNDFATHNSTFNPFGGPTKPKKYHMEKSKLAKEKGIRLIHAWEHYFGNEDQLNVLKNAIKHALGISAHRVYARNTYVKEVPNISLKEFFNKNNIQGFRGAKTAYALFDKKTDEVLMAYSVGSSHFAHNKYDMELIRGASKLDTTIVGGASKLWKYIIENNPEVSSIVYYIDRNIYSGSSISALEGSLSLVSTQEGFWNYFVEEDLIKNRQPSKHALIKELVSTGKVWEIYNAGTETYVWNR